MPSIILILIATLIAVIVAIVIAVAIAGWLFNRQVEREVTDMFVQSKGPAGEIITEADIAHLPDPVQRWLKYAQVIGKEKSATVRLKQKGLFRQSPEQAWMPFTAEQYYTVDPPALIWHTNMRMGPGISISGRDRYINGRGNMLIKVLSLITVTDAKGPEIDQGTLLRFLNEIMWFPTGALAEYITWEPVDSGSARATMSYQGVTGSAIFYFDEQGRFTNMVADRYMSGNNGKYSLEEWTTPIVDGEWKEFQGIRIPASGGQGTWRLDSGDFTYVKLEILEVEYNNPSLY